MEKPGITNFSGGLGNAAVGGDRRRKDGQAAIDADLRAAQNKLSEAKLRLATSLGTAFGGVAGTLPSAESQELYDAIARAPGGLEWLAANDPDARRFLSRNVAMEIAAGPDGINRLLRHLPLFRDAVDLVFELSDDIASNGHPDPELLLSAMHPFVEESTYLFPTFLEALKRCGNAENHFGRVAKLTGEVVGTLVSGGSLDEALQLISAMRMEEEFRSSRDFARQLIASFAEEPVSLLGIAKSFPELEYLMMADVSVMQSLVARIVEGSGSLDGFDTDAVIADFGLTWDLVVRDQAVYRWFSTPSERYKTRARIRSLVDRFKPSRDAVLMMADCAAASIINEGDSSIDASACLALKETFDLSEEEFALVSLETVGLRRVRERLEGDSLSVPLAKRILAASARPDAFLESLRSSEMKAVAWEAFRRIIKFDEFETARGLEFFGLDAEKMREVATIQYLFLLENGMSANRTDELAGTFGFSREGLPPAVVEPAIREGIEACLSANHLGALIEFVRSQRVTPETASVGEPDRRRAESLVKNDIATFVLINEEERSVLKELFGVTVDILRSPDVAQLVETQTTSMIDQASEALRALRAIVPEILSQEWYRDACEKKVLAFIKDGQARYDDVGSFMRNFRDLASLPAEFFRSQEIVAAATVCVAQLLDDERYDSIPPFSDFFGVSPANGLKINLLGGSALPLYLFGGLIDSKTVDAWKAEGVPDAIAILQRGGSSIPKSLTKYYTNRRNFNGLAMAIELGAATVPYETESDAVRELRSMVVNGDGVAAEELLRCYGLTGILFDAALRKRIKDAADAERRRREHREEFPLDAEPHRVEEEMAGFYLDEWIGIELSALERKAGERHVELGFTNRMAAYNARDAIRMNAESQFAWLREYLVRSVLGEMRHQTDGGQRRASFVNVPPNADAWMSTATNEEIRQMMAATADRFREPGWQSSFGGDPWARIAETAEMMFAPEPDRRKLIDLTYDLEHNSGTVLSKEHERISYRSGEQLRQILGMKREVSDPEAFLALLESELSPEAYRTATERWNEWKGVRAHIEARIGDKPEDRRARRLEDIRSLSVSTIDAFQVFSVLDRMETAGLRSFLTSETFASGLAGRVALMHAADKAIRKRMNESGGGIEGVLKQLRRPGWIGTAKVDFFAPILGAYLKARADVARDTAQMNAAQEILFFRRDAHAAVPLTIELVEGIPDEFQRIIDEITNA